MCLHTSILWSTQAFWSILYEKISCHSSLHTWSRMYGKDISVQTYAFDHHPCSLISPARVLSDSVREELEHESFSHPLERSLPHLDGEALI